VAGLEIFSAVVDFYKERNKWDWECLSALAYLNYELFDQLLKDEYQGDKLSIVKDAYPFHLDDPRHLQQYDFKILSRYLALLTVLTPAERDQGLVWFGRFYPWHLTSTSVANKLLEEEILKRFAHRKDVIKSIMGDGSSSLFVQAMNRLYFDRFLELMLKYLNQDELRGLLLITQDDSLDVEVASYIRSAQDLHAIVSLLKPLDYPILLRILNAANKIEFVWELLVNIRPTPQTSELFYHLLKMQDIRELAMANRPGLFYDRLARRMPHLSDERFIEYIFCILPEQNRELFRRYLSHQSVGGAIKSRLLLINDPVLMQVVHAAVLPEDVPFMHKDIQCAFLHMSLSLNKGLMSAWPHRSLVSTWLNRPQSRSAMESVAKEAADSSFSSYFKFRLAFHKAHLAHQSSGLTLFSSVNHSPYQGVISEIENAAEFKWVARVVSRLISAESTESGVKRMLSESWNLSKADMVAVTASFQPSVPTMK
jgi:hypothetical protein